MAYKIFQTTTVIYGQFFPSYLSQYEKVNKAYEKYGPNDAGPKFVDQMWISNLISLATESC